MEKTIYLIRHGESEGNIGTHYQNAETPLSERGVAQAQALAERASRLPLTTIVSSTMRRARQTADHIAERIAVPVEESSLFIERRRPSEQINRPKGDPEAIRSEQEIIKNSGIQGYRFSDEETFEEMIERATKALMFLQQHSSNEILVVTHGVYLRILVLCSLFDKDFTEREFKAIVGGLSSSNTGITVLTYDPERERKWKVITWNDIAHLG